MSDDPFRCICDPDDLFEPPDPRPRAVAGCPAHRARYAAESLMDLTGIALHLATTAPHVGDQDG